MAVSLLLALLVHVSRPASASNTLASHTHTHTQTVLANEGHSAPSDTRSDSLGCVEWAYKTPHCCSPPDCHFMVGWRDGEDQGTIEFHLIATVTRNTSVWAALGFSDDRSMVCVCVGMCAVCVGQR